MSFYSQTICKACIARISEYALGKSQGIINEIFLIAKEFQEQKNCFKFNSNILQEKRKELAPWVHFSVLDITWEETSRSREYS